MMSLFKKACFLLCLSLAFTCTLCLADPSEDNYAAVQYHEAIKDASIIEPGEILPLPAITGPRVRVVTWTKFGGSYPAGKNVRLEWGDIWVTLDGTVRSYCKKSGDNEKVSDLEKLLGLPPGSGAKRVFVTLEVNSTDMFRPCADPSITTHKCTPGFPEDVSMAHQAWYAKQSAEAYRTDPGYPWTRLGYTYNWKEGKSEVGPAEFVVRKGAGALSVSVEDTRTYCRE